MLTTSKELVINTINGIPTERIPVNPHWWGLYKFEISFGMKDYSEEHKIGELDAEKLAKVDSEFYELFKPDIKNDIEKYSTSAMAISKSISEFTKPFIERYVQAFADAKDDKDKIVTGEVFEKMFKEWQNENGNAEEYRALCAKIKNKIGEFKKELLI